MKYHFKVHKEGKHFWAKCLELDGCYTQADSINELSRMMKEALELYISEPEGSTDLAPLPDDSIRVSKTVVEVPVDAEVAFSFLVRYYRIKYGMTQSQVAKKMGYANVNGYQRLERRKCNPNLKTLSKIKEIFPDFSLDLAVV
jgi:predicted RNase H-like HicB family nuclease/DNA-binding XRE family transcriptional regulator